MAQLYTVAALQTNVWPVFARKGAGPAPEHRQKNLDRAVELIARCADWSPSRIYLLPEFFLTGAGGAGSPRGQPHMCVRIPGPETERLGDLARQVDAWIAGMVWEVMDDWPGRYWNTAFIIGPEGKVILKYHKHYDTLGKTKPGDVYDEYVRRYGVRALFPVVDTPIGRLGCLTCYDINFPEVARCLALNGAEILLHPTSEGRAPFLLEDTGGWEICKRARAYENLAYLVSANQGHTLGSDLPVERMRGRTQIIDFHGRVVNIAETSGETLVQADIDLEALRQKRGQLRMNFLAQLQTHVHAPSYQAQELWPRQLWSGQPPANDAANLRAGAETIARLQKAGVLVAPEGPQVNKTSFV